MTSFAHHWPRSALPHVITESDLGSRGRWMKSEIHLRGTLAD